jgi:hypothetical protein
MPGHVFKSYAESRSGCRKFFVGFYGQIDALGIRVHRNIVCLRFGPTPIISMGTPMTSSIAVT